MKEILKQAEQIEKEENIKVLFLIESGSRGWGWASEDSDYDIRGVFVQDYMRFDETKNQIERTIGDNDIVLWDLKKFLRLMIKSNPSVWEWLSSDIIYKDHNIRTILKVIFEVNFSKYALKKHYVSMARQNFHKYIKGIGDKANLKKYVYVLRSIACVLFIEEYGFPPPKNHKDLISLLPKDVKEFFEQIVIDKRKSESLEGPRNRDAENYIVSWFDKEFEKDESSFNTEELNEIFKELIK